MALYPVVAPSGIFRPDQPNFISHGRNVNIKKGYISRGLKYCYRCWLIRSHCLYSKRAFVTGSQLLPYAAFERITFPGENFCFAGIHRMSRELAMFVNG